MAEICLNVAEPEASALRPIGPAATRVSFQKIMLNQYILQNPRKAYYLLDTLPPKVMFPK
jgi:hypothetical protein